MATWIHMKFHVSPNYSSNCISWGWRRNGLCWFYLRSLHPTHGEKFHRERKQTWANESVGLIVSETLMYTTAVLQSKSIQTFLLPLPPLSPPLSPLPFLSHFCLIDVSDGEAGIPAFCSFREELGGGQGVTLRKVTDERAAEEGGGEVALKRVGG